jgi:hypothetical protein
MSTSSTLTIPRFRPASVGVFPESHDRVARIELGDAIRAVGHLASGDADALQERLEGIDVDREAHHDADAAVSIIASAGLTPPSPAIVS